MKQNMQYTKDELKEAERQIASTLHKLRETVKTFESKENAQRYKSQITLATRRIVAFEIAHALVERELVSAEKQRKFISAENQAD